MKEDYTYIVLCITTLVFFISVMYLVDGYILAGSILMGICINIIIDYILFRIWHYSAHASLDRNK